MATLTEIFGRVNVIYSFLVNVLSLLGVIHGNTQNAAQEHSPFAIEGLVAEAESIVASPVYGNAQLEITLGLISSAITAQTATLLAAVGTPQQTGSPVTLPSTFDQEVCDAVWGNTPVGYPRDMGYALVNTAQSVVQANNLGIPPRIGHFMVNAIDFPSNDFQLPSYTYPTYDPTDLLVGDTLLSMMTRQNPAFTVGYGNPPQTNVTLTEPLGAGIGWITDLDETAFSQIKAFVYPGIAPAAAPVWPGMANVTLGASVALVDGLVLTGPLSGVIVAITSVPTPISYYPFGSIKSYVRSGAVLFTDDDGASEFPQPLGPQNEVVLPRAMVSAASCTFRIPSGIVGTAQPFTIP